MDILHQFAQGLGIANVLTPGLLFKRAQYYVGIANSVRIDAADRFGQEVFDLVLVADEQVAAMAVPVCVVERDQRPLIHVDQQGYLALAGPVAALWTTGGTILRVWIEAEIVRRV